MIVRLIVPGFWYLKSASILFNSKPVGSSFFYSSVINTSLIFSSLFPSPISSSKSYSYKSYSSYSFSCDLLMILSISVVFPNPFIIFNNFKLRCFSIFSGSSLSETMLFSVVIFTFDSWFWTILSFVVNSLTYVVF